MRAKVSSYSAVLVGTLLARVVAAAQLLVRAIEGATVDEVETFDWTDRLAKRRERGAGALQLLEMTRWAERVAAAVNL